MKNPLPIIVLMGSVTWGARAQENTPVELKEVEVKAAKTIVKSDRLTLVPTAVEKQSATNGYALLSRLGLPAIRVDEMTHTITALGKTGAVQVRINGAVASKADLLSLDVQTVKNIDFIEYPGVRYGKDIATVIDIRTKAVASGYSLGANLTNALTGWKGDNMVYAKVNRRHSQWGVTYNFGYEDARDTRYSETADYLLSDETHRIISRQTEQYRNLNFNNKIDLQYLFADSATTFQATLSAAFEHTPTYLSISLITDGDSHYTATTRQNSLQSRPVADLYFARRWSEHQSITANVVATITSTNTFSYNNEDSEYQYDVNGNTYSLISEVVYENRFRPLTFTAGMRHHLKFTRNRYSGHAVATNRMHRDGLQLFAEGKGRWRKIGYTIGLAASRECYRQGQYSYRYPLLRPKATIAYTPIPALTMAYSYELSQHISQVAMISDTRIRQNSMEWTVGNPEITPNRVIEHRVNASYTRSSLRTQLEMFYKLNPHCNMAHYERTPDNRFLYSQTIQPGVYSLYASGNADYDLIADKITLSAYGGVYRFINRGSDYNHFLTTYNMGSSVQAYLGRWTLTALADNGWHFMEGERSNRQGALVRLAASYRWKNATLQLLWRQPFSSHPTLLSERLVNRLVSKAIRLTSGEQGNMVAVSLSVRLSGGKAYRETKKTLHNEDRQTGILK